MEFGVWLRQQRSKQQWDLEQLAEKSGVDVSSISRLENQKVEQPTLGTTVKLCQALQLKPAEVLYAFQSEKMAYSQASPVVPTTTGPAPLPGAVLRDLLTLYYTDQFKVAELLADLLHQTQQAYLTRTQKATHLAGKIAPELATLLFTPDQPIYTLAVHYPPALDSQVVLTTYQRNGMLMTEDIWSYLSAARPRKKKTTEDNTGRLYQRLRVTLCHSAEIHAIALVKLDDVLAAEQQWGQAGEVFGMFWQATVDSLLIWARQKIHWESTPTEQWLPQETKLLWTLLALYRWWQSLCPEDPTWLAALDAALK